VRSAGRGGRGRVAVRPDAERVPWEPVGIAALLMAPWTLLLAVNPWQESGGVTSQLVAQVAGKGAWR
jgi:hypothetical protein